MEDDKILNLLDVILFIPIILKLFGLISIGWFWVLSPLWVIIILAIIYSD